jgi:flagellar protein FlgJ
MRADAAAGQFALDMAGLQRLQQDAREDRPEATRAAAQQFEALFLHQLVKGMRATVPTSDLTNSKQTEFYQSLLDQQWAQTLAERGTGLADELVAQLEATGQSSTSSRAVAPSGVSPASVEGASLITGIPRGTPKPLDTPVRPSAGPIPAAANRSGEERLPADQVGAERAAEQPQRLIDALGGRSTGPLFGLDEVTTGGLIEESSGASQGLFDHLRWPPESRAPVRTGSVAGAVPSLGETPESGDHSLADRAQAFLEPLTEPAQAASRRTGVPAELILAQAALETGWGQYQILTPEGQNSHNLFGIKAGSQWQGPTTEVTTHEHIEGQRVRLRDRFRVYESFEAAFTDYASLISESPRYNAVTTAPNAEHAARELQAGGYATDPAYADKLISIMESLGPVVSQASRSPIFFSY